MGVDSEGSSQSEKGRTETKHGKAGMKVGGGAQEGLGPIGMGPWVETGALRLLIAGPPNRQGGHWSGLGFQARVEKG